MERNLTKNEKEIYDLFKGKLTLKQTKDVSGISLNVKKQKLVVGNPLVYEIEDTDSVLILGTPRQTINIDLLKKLYEEQLKKKAEKEMVSEVEDDQKRKEEIIALVKSQVEASEEEVKRTLEENGYDVVKTLMDLSK